MIIGDRLTVKSAPMPPRRKKFATQGNSEVLAAVRDLAEKEGRQIHALVKEALGDLVEKHRECRARPNVMAAYLASHKRYGCLYRRLAE